MTSSEREKLFLTAYETHADAIFRLCFFKLSDRDRALDAAQEIFMKMWKYLQEGNEVRNPKAFLFVTASNHIKDQWRKKKAIPLSSLESGDDNGQTFDVPDEKVDLIEGVEYSHALRFFSSLPDDERTLLQLRFVEDMAVKDIATILKERENTVAVRISRSLTELRRFYKDNHGI